MLNSRRIFVDAIKRYCARNGIAIELKSDGWLIVMQRAELRRCAFGYDIGLNSAVAHRLANDKAATAEILEMAGVACVPHTLFLSPEMNEYISKPGSCRRCFIFWTRIRKDWSSSRTKAPRANPSSWSRHGRRSNSR